MESQENLQQYQPQKRVRLTALTCTTIDTSGVGPEKDH